MRVQHTEWSYDAQRIVAVGDPDTLGRFSIALENGTDFDPGDDFTHQTLTDETGGYPKPGDYWLLRDDGKKLLVSAAAFAKFYIPV